ncbi:sigma-54-dependent transcriptional regulator [Sphingomonas lacunae]|uniref:sigma-54-dependent transcriptional regulator n=1 Tax=Sphingomonas lacunae TaxID=2698828 RepID=UPI001472BE95|nr:sigma-54 dependent transcriptional regulator [Sphingomonas lacunae]
MTHGTILVVEDIASLAMAYAAQLESAGYACVIADSGAAAIAELDRHGDRIKGILLDLQLPDTDGLELLQTNGGITSRWPVVVATADGSINRAIEAMRLGAFDFLVKPLAPQRLITIMRSAVQPLEALATPARTPVRAATTNGFMGFVGMSPPMLGVYRQIENVARSRATVFITGESGTGKEVCAEAIHKASPRGGKPFIAINCGAIPEDLLESELFGHLKGSFTGAVSDRIGAVQAAQGGTLFLDEICEMELRLQVKLLRFLQTGTVQRVGSNRTEDVDVRIICATNRDPEAEVAAGRFREDLYYRLAVVPIELPPLRARGHDIELIANTFLQRFGKEEGKNFDRITPEFARGLASHKWPGNVRELQNLIRRAAVMFEGPALPEEALPRMARLPRESAALSAEPVTGQSPACKDPAAPVAPLATDDLAGLLRGMTLDDIERLVVETAITDAGGSLPAAARALGVSPSTLYRKRERWIEQGLAS